MNDELERIWNEAAAGYSRYDSGHFPGKTQENQEIPQP
jgi:hypothetical protein